MNQAKEILSQNNDWITFSFLAIIIVLSIIKFMFNDRLFHISTLFLSKKYLLIYFNKEKNMVLNLFQTLFFLIQVLTLSLLFYVVNNFYEFYPDLLNFKGFLMILGGISGYFSLRYVTGAILANIFNLRNDHKKLVYDKINYFNNLILWLLPLLVMVVYGEIFKEVIIKIALLWFVFMLMIRYWFVLSSNKSFLFKDLFYFILYLCALEIAPLIIILKLTF